MEDILLFWIPLARNHGLMPFLGNSDCTLIITQIREKAEVVFENPEQATGGCALKYYTSIHLDVRGIESLKQGGEVIGNRARVKVYL